MGSMPVMGLLVLLVIFVVGLFIGAACGGFLVYLLMRNRQAPRGFDVITKE
jgi:hypothetical protein